MYLSEIQKLFDPDLWDVGFLSKQNLKRSGSAPIKAVTHLSGHDLTSMGGKFTPYNGIVLARYSDVTSDYSLYQDSFDILNNNLRKDSFQQVYVNFKEAALLSGIGSRARNSLIYNRKFGFNCKFCAYVLEDDIIDTENLKPQKNLLDLCEGCDDCIKNCPANAIHEDWVDAESCDDFISWGDHPTIPSIKWFWYEKMKPNYTEEEVISWKNSNDGPPFEWGQGIDGYYELGETYLTRDGKSVAVPHCNQCQCQPKCSKAPIHANN